MSGISTTAKTHCGLIRESNMSDAILTDLAATIRARRADSADKSYTRQLLEGGPKRCAKKLGEEATETVIAALSEDDAALKNEAADLLYHLLVLLEARRIDVADVLDILAGRMGTSGLDEKAARPDKKS
jgi:phosphoribosyl-ATP pyrophosphohydrolase